MASEMSDFYNEIKAINKARRLQLMATNKQIISDWCAENNIQQCEIAEGQIRLIINGNEIDIFTKSNKYHNITYNKRGAIKNSLFGFLNSNL